jgi:hypothetical protein
MIPLTQSLRALFLLVLAGLFLLTIDMAVAQQSLGNLSANPYDPKSTANLYGRGSPYHPQQHQ